MPRALQVCTTPSCPTLTTRGRCEACRRGARRTQAQARRTQGDPSMAAYSTHAWRSSGPAFFTQHPHCVDCGAEATQRDHVPPRRLLVALHIRDPDHPRWLQPRCDSCHSTKTATLDTPLLQRWQAGEDAAQLAEEAMGWHQGVG